MTDHGPGDAGDDGPRAARHPPRNAAELQEQIRHTRQEIRDQVRATRMEFDQANARVTARVGRNLVLAIAIGVVFGGLVIASLVVLKVVFVAVAMALVGFGTWELAGAMRHAGIRVPRAGSAVAGVLAVPVVYVSMLPASSTTLPCIEQIGRQGCLERPAGSVSPSIPTGWLLAIVGAVVVAVVWRLVQQAVGRRGSGPLVRDLGATMLVQLYVTLLGSCAVALLAQRDGQWWVLSFLAVVVATDLFAYVSGLLFGKHPMAPRISPKKTWEGFAGSVIAAIVLGELLATLVLHEPWWFGLVFGAVLAVVGTVGDLGESMIKRDIGIKDMSSRLPGHGGILDRIDSVLPAGAAALLLLFAVR